MKTINRLFILQFLFLLMIPIAFSEITITLPEKDIYNLGEKIAPSVAIKLNQNYSGVFELHISCDNDDFLHHAEYLEDIAAGFWRQLTINERTLLKPVFGKCRLMSSFESNNGEIIDTASSEYFEVTDKVNVITDKSLEAKPREDVIISGEVRKSSNELMQEGEAKISFKGSEEKVSVVAGKFEHTIHLENDIEAGNTQILVVVTDKYANYGDQLVDLKVLAIPARIENIFEDNILMPGDTLKARVILYDHNNKAINGSRVNVRIFSPDEELIAENDIQNKNYFEFKTGKTQIPGNYFLLSTFDDIKEQSTFEIETVRKIIMEQENDLVYVENTGNVRYKDEVTIILETGDENTVILNKKIDLEPGEEITIDLSREVPEGTYNVILPEEAVSTSDDAETENMIEGITIADNRPVLKKTASGISAIAGAVISAAGYVASRPALAATILVLIIVGTVARYSKDFIASKVKGKKKEDTSHIFEDFKYEKK